jgi:hypothetical protein
VGGVVGWLVGSGMGESVGTSVVGATDRVGTVVGSGVGGATVGDAGTANGAGHGTDPNVYVLLPQCLQVAVGGQCIGLDSGS